MQSAVVDYTTFFDAEEKKNKSKYNWPFGWFP